MAVYSAQSNPSMPKTPKLSFDEVVQISTEYFNGDSLAASVFTKYALQDKEGGYLESNPEKMHSRLAKEVDRIDSKYRSSIGYDRWYEYFTSWRLVPQGSPMSGIGNPFQIQSIGNCFVIPSVLDSYAGIMYTDQQQVQIMKRRGGVGHDISNLRPKGMPTNNAAKTTDGIGIFMERFSSTTREVAQNGRRGALMLSISVHHPEIETFINIKKDRKKVTGANISIRVTDEFMQAVKDGGLYELRYPVDPKEPRQYSKMVEAKAIMDQIAQAAWDSAEPGILMWDHVIRESPADCYGDVGFTTTSTNPCQPAWATVLTPDGISTIGEIEIGSTIWSGKQWTKVVNKFSTGEKQVNAYRTKAGTFYGTENHRVVSQGEKIEVGQADSIDVATGPAYERPQFYSMPIMDGLMIGDGTWHNASSKNFLIVGKDDSSWISELPGMFIKESGAGPGYWHVRCDLPRLPKTFEREVPEEYRTGDIHSVCGFLRGLYSANGSVVGNRVTLKASSFKIIEAVQEMLSSIGIPSYFTTNKAHDVEFGNGTYTCKESYDLNIGTLIGRQLFARCIGFIQPYKQAKLADICSGSSKLYKKTFDIVEVEPISFEEVFDLTVEAEEHTYWTGGLLVSNCGELPLCPEDSCRLLLLCVERFVENKFTDKASLDWAEFEKAAYHGQYCMDDLVDIELEQIDKILAKIHSDPEPAAVKSVELDLWYRIKEKCALGRRTGLGITGLGDAMAMLGIKYGSGESIDFTDKVYRTLAMGSYKASIDMAEQRGAFPAWNLEKEKGHPFIERILKELPKTYQKRYEKFGRRNIANLTTAPAGSVSCLTQTTSGCEPAIFLSYKRRRKVNPGFTGKVDFIDELGDSWEEYKVYHHGHQKWMEITGETDESKSPYFGATAEEIDPLAKIRIQAAAQKWVDHAISNTTNLPESATPEQVADIYMTAWELKCKGVTVYRSGSRSGVLVKDGPKKQLDGQIIETNAPKRPETLECDLHRSRIKGEEYLIVVGLLNGHPYEVFAGLAQNLEVGKKETKGKLVKKAKKYKLLVGDEEFDDIVAQFDNPNYGAFTRTLSTALRHGVPVKYLVEQLRKDKHSDLFSFSSIMARVFAKHYIKDGVKLGKACPECQSSNIAYVQGCPTCQDCGYSKCG